MRFTQDLLSKTPPRAFARQSGEHRESPPRGSSPALAPFLSQRSQLQLSSCLYSASQAANSCFSSFFGHLSLCFSLIPSIIFLTITDTTFSLTLFARKSERERETAGSSAAIQVDSHKCWEKERETVWKIEKAERRWEEAKARRGNKRRRRRTAEECTAWGRARMHPAGTGKDNPFQSICCWQQTYSFALPLCMCPRRAALHPWVLCVWQGGNACRAKAAVVNRWNAALSRGYSLAGCRNSPRKQSEWDSGDLNAFWHIPALGLFWHWESAHSLCQ